MILYPLLYLTCLMTLYCIECGCEFLSMLSGFLLLSLGSFYSQYNTYILILLLCHLIVLTTWMVVAIVSSHCFVTLKMTPSYDLYSLSDAVIQYLASLLDVSSCHL